MPEADACEQMDLFVDYETMQEWKRRKEAEQAREKKIQSTVLDIKRRFGKNAILKGTALEDGATSRERNTTTCSSCPIMSLQSTLRRPAMTGRRSFLPLQP